MKRAGLSSCVASFVASCVARVGLVAILSAVLLSLSGCASYFVRKECEKTDWYQFGHDVAMGGNRLTGNNFVMKCEQAEAEINHTALNQGFRKGMSTYCLPETAHATGKRGEFFSPDMCDGENLRKLKQQHEQGVLSYCQKSNGQAAGATGKKYNQICPKELEEAFLIEFNKGRKKYLAAQITQGEAELDDIERNIRNLEYRRMNLTTELSGIRGNQIIRREMKYDPHTRTHKEELSVQDNPDVEHRRTRVTNDIQSVDTQISSERNKQDEIRQKIRGFRSELLTL